MDKIHLELYAIQGSERITINLPDDKHSILTATCSGAAGNDHLAPLAYFGVFIRQPGPCQFDSVGHGRRSGFQGGNQGFVFYGICIVNIAQFDGKCLRPGRVIGQIDLHLIRF